MTCELSLPYSKVKRERGAAAGREGRRCPRSPSLCPPADVPLSPAVAATSPSAATRASLVYLGLAVLPLHRTRPQHTQSC